MIRFTSIVWVMFVFITFGYSHPTKPHAKIDAVFVLDSTGSMGGLIQTAKDKIWAIANTMAQAQPTPEIRIGFITYRDRGDQYITKISELTSDLDTAYSDLMSTKAGGGGDTPESVNQALNEAVHKFSWSKDKDAYKVVFLVGDAPPHMDYEQDVKYYLSCNEATKRGITVNTIQCGNMKNTEKVWKEIAKLGSGDYFKVDQNGGSVAVTTPYDKDISQTSQKLDQKKVYWGNRRELGRLKAKKETQRNISEKSSLSSLAQRAEYNMSSAGKYNNESKNDICKLSESEIKKISKKELPSEMQAMDEAEQIDYVSKLKNEQNETEKKLKDLTLKRRNYLAKKAKEVASSDKSNFENSVFRSIRKQAKEVANIEIKEAPSL